MSVKAGLLALLAEQPMHCYQLRQQFEARTGGTWPLNTGQVYTTLHRLLRDGLVEPVQGSAGDGPPAGAEQFRLTDAGRACVAAWWTTPVDRGDPARDELVVKLALAVTTPGIAVRDVVQLQRTATMAALHEYTRLKKDVAGDDLAWSLVLDNLVFATEAEVRWLDHVEARVSRAAGPARSAGRGNVTTDGAFSREPAIRGSSR